jgi:hypothetical protein
MDKRTDTSEGIGAALAFLTLSWIIAVLFVWFICALVAGLIALVPVVWLCRWEVSFGHGVSVTQQCHRACFMTYVADRTLTLPEDEAATSTASMSAIVS